MRILRARNAGTGSGGAGNPKSAPGATANVKEGSFRDPLQLREFAALRQKARAAISRTSIGSRGRL